MADLAELRQLTIQQWIELDEDESGEFVDGLLEEEEVASFAHELAVAWLVRLLADWFEPRGGFVFGSETKLVISTARGRKPDVVVYTAERGLPPRLASASNVSPEIVVEVVTARPKDARRDRVEKKPDYAAAGVHQYWILDPVVRTLEVLTRNADGRFLEVLAASQGQHQVPDQNGLTIDLDALWAKIDRLPTGSTDS